MRKVINKMVTEDDLIRTVATAYGAGLAAGEALLHVRPADRDRRGRRSQIARARASASSQTGREVSGQQGHPLHRLHRRLRAQAAHPVPVGGAARPRDRPTRGCVKLRDAIRADRSTRKAIGFRYHDGKPGIVEGLLSRGDRRVGAVIERCGADGGRFDGWSEHFSFERWMAAARRVSRARRRRRLVHDPRARAAPRCCPGTTSTPGLDKDWLWEDWQDALDEVEVEDCRWTPCFDCGVCPQMGTDIQVGPTGRPLLPLSPSPEPELASP